MDQRESKALKMFEKRRPSFGASACNYLKPHSCNSNQEVKQLTKDCSKRIASQTNQISQQNKMNCQQSLTEVAALRIYQFG